MRRGGPSADHVDGITVDQIKRLMLCFAKRPPKAFFNRYASMALPTSTKDLQQAATGTASDNNATTNSGSLLKARELSPEWSRKSKSNNLTHSSGSSSSSSDDDDKNNDNSHSHNKSDADLHRNERLLDNTASMFNVKLRPLNRAVFIERVRVVLPDRPDSVINSWFNQLDTDRVGLVTWSAFSAFLLFRSATLEAADARMAEFHNNPEAPEQMPPAVVRHNNGPATCVLMNPRSGDFLTAGADGVITAWHPTTLEPRGAVLTLRSYITGMELMDGGSKIAISCMDRSVTIVDSRTMRIVRCFAGRSIPKHMEATEVREIIKHFEKRPDWVHIERGPRVLTAPPEVPSFATILENVKRGGSPVSAAIDGSRPSNKSQQQKDGGSSKNHNKERGGGSPLRLGGGAVQGQTARHLDRPWVQSSSHHRSSGAGGGSSGEQHHYQRNPNDMDEVSAIGTYLIGEAALARSDASRRTEIHALLDLDKCPTCMCTFPFSESPEETKGRVSSGIIGCDSSIESGAQFQPDPVLFGMPDGVIKQYNLPTMFPRAVTPRATWRPHTDAVRMIRYVAEINGVLSCSDDGTFVMSHPDRRAPNGSCILRHFKVPSTHALAPSLMQSSLSSSGGVFSGSVLSGGGGGTMTMAEQMRLKMGFSPTHVPAVVCFDFSAELKMIACCAYDRHAFLFDATQDTHTAKLSGLSAPAVAIAFNGVDNQVVVAAADRTLRIYDTRHSDLPLQVLERPPFQQFGHIGNRGILVHDRRIYCTSNFPVSYCSRSQFTEAQARNAPPTGNKIGRDQSSGLSARGSKSGGGSGGGSSYSRALLLRRRNNNKGTQVFHTTPVISCFVDDLGASSGVLRLFTLCPQQMMCWTLQGGDSLFSLPLPSTSTGRNQNSATCACASEGCLKVVVGYDDGSVVLWVPAVGEAAARLPDHETIHARVRCTAVCYRRSFAVKQMLILASIDNTVLFLKQGEPYTLEVTSSWTSPSATSLSSCPELGPVTCMHELGTSNSVLCGTQAGALIVLSLTTSEQEGGPMWPSAKVAVTNKNNSSSNGNGDKKQKKQQHASDDDDDEDDANEDQYDENGRKKVKYDDNDFGRVESIVHYPSFGPNVYAAVHVNGDVVFWDCVHRVQVGALCIRGMQTAITHTIVRDFGTFQLLVYTDDLGNLFVRQLEYLVVGSNINAVELQHQHSSGSGCSGGDAAGGGGSPMTGTLSGSMNRRQTLDPYVATNPNDSSSPALVVAGSRNAGVSAACNIVAVYKAPWDGFRSSHLLHQSADGNNDGDGSNNHSGQQQQQQRRKSTTFDDLGEQIDESELIQAPPEYICVITSNVTVNDVKAYCFELTDGFVCHVGSGGTAQWLAAPKKSEMSYCVDSEDWKLQMEASVSLSGLNNNSSFFNSSGGVLDSPQSHQQQNQDSTPGGASSAPFTSLDNSPEAKLQQVQPGGKKKEQAQQRRLSDESLASPLDENLTTGGNKPTTRHGQNQQHQQQHKTGMELPALLIESPGRVDNDHNQNPGRKSPLLGAKKQAMAAKEAEKRGEQKHQDNNNSDAIPQIKLDNGDQQQQQEFSRSGGNLLGGFGADDPDSRSQTPTNGKNGVDRRVSFQDEQQQQEEDESDMLIRKKKEMQREQAKQQRLQRQQKAELQQQQNKTAGRASTADSVSTGRRTTTGGGFFNDDDDDDDGGVGAGNVEADNDDDFDNLSESEKILRGDYLQQQLFHKPRPPTTARPSAAATISAAKPVERPLSLIVPRSHNSRGKKVQRMTSMVRADALEDLRKQKLAKANSATGGGDETGASNPLTPMVNRGWRVVRNAQSAIQGMTPRTLMLSSARQTNLHTPLFGGGGGFLSTQTTATFGQQNPSMTVSGDVVANGGAPSSSSSRLSFSSLRRPNQQHLQQQHSSLNTPGVSQRPSISVNDNHQGHEDQHHQSSVSPLPMLVLPGEAGNEGETPNRGGGEQQRRASFNPDASLADIAALPIPTLDVTAETCDSGEHDDGNGDEQQQPQQQQFKKSKHAPTPLPNQQPQQLQSQHKPYRPTPTPGLDQQQQQQALHVNKPYRPTPTPGLDQQLQQEQQQSTTTTTMHKPQPPAGSHLFIQTGNATSASSVFSPLASPLNTALHTAAASPGTASLSAGLAAMATSTRGSPAAAASPGGVTLNIPYEYPICATPALPDDDKTTFTQHFQQSSTAEEVAHRQLDLMKNRFKLYSSEVQDQVEKVVRRTQQQSSGASAAGGSGASKPIRSDAKDLIIVDSQLRRLDAEPLDGYPDADCLLNVLREKKPLEMHRAMGGAGKFSIFGVLTPSQELLEKWKQKQAEEDAARLKAQAASDLLIPSRAEAGIAFAQPTLTQMRGRKIPKPVVVRNSVQTLEGPAPPFSAL